MKTLDEAFDLMFPKDGETRQAESKRITGNFQRYKAIYRDLLANPKSAVFAGDLVRDIMKPTEAHLHCVMDACEVALFSLFTGVAIGIEMERGDFGNLEPGHKPKRKRKPKV